MADAPVVVPSIDAAATVSTAAQGLYAEANKSLTGKTWGDYTAPEPVAPTDPAVAEPELDATGERPRNPDGTFKAKEADEPVAVEGEAPEVVAEPEVVEPEPYVLSIPSHREGEADVEIAFAGLTDEQQEHLNRLKNDGMRGKDARAKVAKADAMLSELKAFETMLQTNPEHVILKSLPEDKQVSIAVKLIAQHWDKIVPAIQQMDTDPVERIKTASRAEIEIRDNQRTFEQNIAQQRAASEVRAVLLATIPENTPDDTAERFYDDAVNAIRVAESRGTQVTAQNLPDILSHHVRLYGFTPQSAPGAVAKPSIARALARPAAPSAVPAPVVPTDADRQALEQARTGQARLSGTITAQRRAAGSAPPGAGAAPTRLPPVPKDADIETASRELKKAGRTWANASF